MEFFYNIFAKASLPDGTVPKNSLTVKIGNNAYPDTLYKNEHLSFSPERINLDISKWVGKRISIQMEISNDPNFGTEIFGVYFYNYKANPTRVLFISLDSVSAEHLSLYGYKGFDTTPFLKKMCEDEKKIVVFSHAYGQSFWTLPSHATMFSGLYPSQHGLYRVDINNSFNPKIKTLDQALNEKGIYVYHSISHSRLSHEYGFSKGAVLHSDDDGKNADYIFNSAVELAKGMQDRDLFIFLHIWDAHYPYTEYPSDYKDISRDIEPKYDEPMIHLNYNTGKKYDPRNRQKNKSTIYEKNRPKIIANERAYDLGIRLLDQKLNIFFEKLRELGLWDKMWLILTADHGEEFCEHGGFTHSSLYNKNIHVPLIIKPDFRGGNERKKEAISIPIEAHMVIYSFVMEIFRKKSSVAVKKIISNKDVFSEFLPDLSAIGKITDSFTFYQAALIRGDMKIIMTEQFNKITKKQFDEYCEMYNLKTDPEEQKNLYYLKENQKDASYMKNRILERIKKEHKVQYGPPLIEELGKEQLEKLRSLGYIRKP
jgi:arylsulfatase A-like enzyme